MEAILGIARRIATPLARIFEGQPLQRLRQPLTMARTAIAARM
jgi:hypothetical protein